MLRAAPHVYSLSGNAILWGRDKGAETVPKIRSTASRDKMRARIPANSGLFAKNREISVCIGVRGGPGRTRTRNQSPCVATSQWQKGLDFGQNGTSVCVGGDGTGCRHHRETLSVPLSRVRQKNVRSNNDVVTISVARFGNQGMRLEPQGAGGRGWINASSFPPSGFVALTVEFAVMSPA
jgi:hypothetical protein